MRFDSERDAFILDVPAGGDHPSQDTLLGMSDGASDQRAQQAAEALSRTLRDVVATIDITAQTGADVVSARAVVSSSGTVLVQRSGEEATVRSVALSSVPGVFARIGRLGPRKAHPEATVSLTADDMTHGGPNEPAEDLRSVASRVPWQGWADELSDSTHVLVTNALVVDNDETPFRSVEWIGNRVGFVHVERTDEGVVLSACQPADLWLALIEMVRPSGELPEG